MRKSDKKTEVLRILAFWMDLIASFHFHKRITYFSFFIFFYIDLIACFFFHWRIKHLSLFFAFFCYIDLIARFCFHKRITHLSFSTVFFLQRFNCKCLFSRAHYTFVLFFIVFLHIFNCIKQKHWNIQWIIITILSRRLVESNSLHARYT